LRPSPAEQMAYPVSTWVNSVAHSDKRCIEPAALGDLQGQ
jgi:putative SOS response-associated peptidase YedK